MTAYLMADEREAVMDEEIIGVMADALWDLYDARTGPGPRTEGAVHALAALRAEGFDIYRPDDCTLVHRVEVPGVEATRTHYRLVPAERGETK